MVTLMGDEKKFTSVSIPVPLFRKVEERMKDRLRALGYID